MLSREFFTAGRAVFTVEPDTAWLTAQRALGNSEWHDHYSYRIDRVGFDDGREMFFVKSLAGPERWVYLGCFNPTTGAVWLTAKSAFPATATRVLVVQRVLKAVWGDRGDKIEAAGWKVHHEGRCGRCARSLTTPESCERGIGPECWEMMCAAARPETAEAF